MKNGLANTVSAVLVLCALTMTGLVARRELSPQPARRAPDRPELRDVPGWRALATEGHLMGSAQAPVKIVEFSDFQCPFCAEAHRTLGEVRRKYGDRVAVVYRHFPLNGHPHAARAALATECAGEQGAFEPYHDELFANRDSIGVTSWEAFARRAGVADVERFDTCMAEEKLWGAIRRDRAAAERLEIRGTPAFVVDGKLFTGSYPMAFWDERLAAAFAHQP